MLFHVTHHHTEATCPAHDDEVAGKTFGIVLDSLKENVNEVIGAWVDGGVDRDARRRQGEV